MPLHWIIDSRAELVSAVAEGDVSFADATAETSSARESMIQWSGMRGLLNLVEARNVVLTSGRPCRSIQHQGAKRALPDLYDLLSAETPSQDIRDAQSNTDLRKLLLRQPHGIQFLQGRINGKRAVSSKGGLFGAARRLRGSRFQHHRRARAAGAGPPTSRITHLAGSQPATRMTYWLARTASDYNNYAARTLPGQSKGRQLPARHAGGRRQRSTRRSTSSPPTLCSTLRSPLVVRHRVPALCPEHGGLEVVDPCSVWGVRRVIVVVVAGARRALDREGSRGLGPTMASPTGPGPPATRGSPQTPMSRATTWDRRVLLHRPRVRPHARPEARPRDHAQRRARPGVRQPRVLGDDLPDVHLLAVRSDRKGSRRLIFTAELHDVRHLSAAVDVRGEFQRFGKADTYRYLWHGTSGQQERDQRQANTGLSSTGKIFSTVWTQGAGGDPRPQRLRPGPGRRPQARPLADLLQRPARRPQPRQRVGPVQGPGQHLQRAALLRRPPGRPSPTSPPASATTR